MSSVLGALDDKIELNRRMNETLEVMARAIFKDWFVDFGPTRAKMEGHAPYLAADVWALFKAMFHGFDYASGLAGTGHERLVVLAGANEWILARQHEAAAQAKTDDDKRRENRRYQDAMLALSKAFALSSASDEARAIRDEVGFFQTVRAALVKSAAVEGGSTADKDFAIQQILDRDRRHPGRGRNHDAGYLDPVR